MTTWTTQFVAVPAQPESAVRGEGVMTNIPTDLLRTLVAVVDLRSFTKAAQSLGVTQPAVSAQIKRLQGLLGADLLDKSAPGVSLTSAGELVVNYARRLLSINDQILDIAGPRPAAKTVRIGATGDFTASGIALGLTCSRVQRPDLRFEVYSANIDVLLRDLREGDADLAIWVSSTGPTIDTRHYWTEPLVWVHAAVDADRSEPAGAAGLLRRGMPVHAQRHGGAEPGRPRMRAGLHRIEPARAWRRGGGGLRRHGAAARPRRHSRHHGLGRCAAAEAAGHLLRHLCARRRRCGRARADRRNDRRGAASGIVARSPRRVRRPERLLRPARSPSAAPSRSCAPPASPSAST